MNFIVVDAGKTKTVAILLNEKGEILGKSIEGPAGVWLGEKTAFNNLRNAINNCITSANLDLGSITSIVISWADLDTRRDWELARKIIHRLKLPSKIKVIIEHDAVAAFYAVTHGEPGVAVIAGTGSIAFGMNSKGERARASGWGWIIGDEGSAYWIAKESLNAASRAYDSRGEETMLIEEFKNFFNVDDLLEIAFVIHHKIGNDPAEISKLATITDKVAMKGDPVARRIMLKAGEELALSGIAVAKKLGMESEDILIGGVGSVFKSTLVSNAFKETINKFLPNAYVKKPLIGLEPIKGPLIIALTKLNINLDEKTIKNILKNIK